MLYLLISILLYSFFLLENETNTEVAFLFIPSLCQYALRFFNAYYS